MRLPTVGGANAKDSASAEIDQAEVNRHVDYAIASGVNYFDTAPVYCQGRSEAVIGEALARHPREKWLIATKLSNMNPSLRSFEASRKMYEQSFRHLRTGCIDYYLLHTVGQGGPAGFDERFVKNGILDFLVKEREAGRIRNLGFSYHGDEAGFRHALSYHGRCHWDFAQIQLSYVDWRHGTATAKYNHVNAEVLYKLLDELAIPVSVMAPTLGGRLAKFNYAISRCLSPLDPDATPASWAFRFAGSMPRVFTVLSGMTRLEFIKENVKTFSPLRPLGEREFAALERAAKAYLGEETIPCNRCDYCMPCPFGLDIPAILGCWNEAVADGRLPDSPGEAGYAAQRRRFLVEYERAVPPLRRADHCIGCGRCSPHCPQSIDIPAALRRVDSLVEKLRRNGRV
jgi:predicted aldo/keto reductase-like oxidoreductase